MVNRFVALPKEDNGEIIKTYLYKENRSTNVREVSWGPSSDTPELLFIPKAHATDTRR